MFIKDPDATLDYKREWADWLGTDTIATSTWIVPEGITEGETSHDATSATIWLSGGTVGEVYELTNRVTTTGGRTDDRSFNVQIRNR